MAARLESLRSPRRRAASWWDDTDLEGSAGFSRGSARLQPVCTRQAEFWEEREAPDADPAPKSDAHLGELFAASVVAEPEPQPMAESPAEGPAPERARASRPSGGSYAERTPARTTARMAPYLRLSGVLQTADREESSFELPRARFRPRLRLGVERKMSIDLIGDVRPPPRSYASGERSRLSGEIAL